MRSLILIPLLFALAACGFRPVYGTQYQAERGVATARLAEIEVSIDSSRYSQLLKAELEDRLNPEHIAADKRFQLQLSLSEINVPLFVAQDGTYGRGNLQYTLLYSLQRKGDSKVVDSGKIQSMSSYAASETNAIYASHVAQQDARKRGMTDLANDIAMRLGNALERDIAQ